jgi:hypothetical protein
MFHNGLLYNLMLASLVGPELNAQIIGKNCKNCFLFFSFIDLCSLLITVMSSGFTLLMFCDQFYSVQFTKRNKYFF